MDITDEELRRRIRAAMGASGLDTWPKLEAATGLSESLLRNLGKSRGRELKHVNAIRAATGVPYEWFTVADLAEAVRLGAGLLESEARTTREATALEMAQRSSRAASRRAPQRPDTGKPSGAGRDRPREAD